MNKEKPPSLSEMREALRVLRRRVRHNSLNFKLHYKYKHFINELLTVQKKTNQRIFPS